jgi:hypothetical protein
MAKVGHLPRVEWALGLLDEKSVLLQRGEDEVDMLEVFRPRGAIKKDIVEEDQHKPVKERAEDVVHQRLECCRRIG